MCGVEAVRIALISLFRWGRMPVKRATWTWVDRLGPAHNSLSIRRRLCNCRLQISQTDINQEPRYETHVPAWPSVCPSLDQGRNRDVHIRTQFCDKWYKYVHRSGIPIQSVYCNYQRIVFLHRWLFSDGAIARWQHAKLSSS